MLKILIDFDGTITTCDVGDAMFEHFGGHQCAGIIEAYHQERISAAECFRQESAACGDVTMITLDAFLDQQQIDPTFPAFVQFCADAGYDMTILSDGMDYYISRILSNHGLSGVRFFSNHLNFENAGKNSLVRFEPEFPYQDETCDRCACCKRNHILTSSADDDTIVYVGEGYSDRCPARYADVVFAKDNLLRYCQKENISYFEYRSFADIQDRMVKTFSQPGKKRLFRKGKQAERARRDVFLGG